MKRLFIFIAAIFAAAMAFGQTPLPNDPAVRTGKLENGMTYYIRHNDQPAQRAEFYLATDVGAFQEDDDQDGLAHFLEHMCFNGTKNFPGKSLLEWLQSIGAEFGRNINASTGFEQTQYMLNNIPVVRESILDSCLLVLHDYSHFVTNDPAEIDAERGVILEEKRTRNDASWRLFEKSLPYYYGDTPYARRTLIGGEEQLKTFKYESLTRFYETWCRPDLQAVIVVGDVDVDQVENKIKTIFADIPAAENPQPKVLHKIPDNVEPIIGILTDPEMTSSSIEVMWKSEPMPKELMNTDVAFMMDIIKTYIRLIMRERFTDITSQPDAPFLGGSFYISNLCNSCDATEGSVSFKEGDAINAFTAFMTELEKMKRFGFTDGEVQRAKENIISSYERRVEAAPTRKNAEFVYPLLYNFYDNKPYMEPEMELQLAQMVCSQLNAALLSQVAAQLLTDENMVILYNGPEKAGLTNPTEEEIKAVLAAVKNAEIAANVEENLNAERQVPQIDIDAELHFAEINLSFFNTLQKFAPFGPDNNKPVFVTYNVVDYQNRCRLVGQGKKHIKLDVRDLTGGPTMSGIAFNAHDPENTIKYINSGMPFHICYTLEENNFNGKKSIQLMIKDIKIPY